MLIFETRKSIFMSTMQGLSMGVAFTRGTGGANNGGTRRDKNKIHVAGGAVKKFTVLGGTEEKFTGRAGGVRFLRGTGGATKLAGHSKETRLNKTL